MYFTLDIFCIFLQIVILCTMVKAFEVNSNQIQSNNSLVGLEIGHYLLGLSSVSFFCVMSNIFICMFFASLYIECLY